MDAIDYYRRKPFVIDALMAALRDKRKDFLKADPATAKIGRFLQENKLFQRLDEHLSSFNVFSAINVSGAEIRHSNFLAWMLCPDGSHGFGDKYLRVFLRVAGYVSTNSGHPASKYGKLEDWKLDGAIVKPEFTQGSKLKRIDLVITLPKEKAVIVVENKIHSGQRKGQLAEYHEIIENEATFRGYKKLFVFLTLKGEPPEMAAFLPVTYHDLVAEFIRDSGTHQAYTAEDALAMLLQHYLEIISRSEASDFNLFRALKADQKELRHSDMLAWLLRTGESHGLGSLFLDGLLKVLSRKCKLKGFSHKLGGKPEIAIYREFQDIDILVVCESEKWLIAIENKWGSKESKQQLLTYRRFLEAQFPDFNRRYVFLTLDGSQPSDSAYVGICYADLVPLVQVARRRITGRVGSVAEQIALFAAQYFNLVTLQLKSVDKAKVQLPNGVATICEALYRQNPIEIAGLLGQVLCWQRNVIRQTDNILYRLVDKAFGRETFKNSYKVWHRFVPPEFDEIESLQRSSADEMLQFKLVQYTFHTIPFGPDDVPYGSNAAVEKKGIFLTLGMARAKAGFEDLRKTIYSEARKQPEIFNCATVEDLRGDRFSTLITLKLASVEDFLRHDLSALEPILAARFGRFVQHQHQHVIRLLRKPEVANFTVDD